MKIRTEPRNQNINSFDFYICGEKTFLLSYNNCNKCERRLTVMKFNEVMRKAIGETKDLSMAYLEKGLDSFLDEGVLKEIPVVKTVYTALKLPISVANAL